MKESERPKRLAPTTSTARELYLRSGNECAFPGCRARIIDETGNFVGELCHITAALPGGERFDASMSNEKRRSADNLMLMCHEHHVVTDDVDSYDVARLTQMKQEHEERFSRIPEAIRASIADLTATQTIEPAKTGTALNAALGWNLTREELDETVALINRFFTTLQKVPRSTLELAAIAVDRGRPTGAFTTNGMATPLGDLEEACGLSPRELKKHIEILEHHSTGFVEIEEGCRQLVIRGTDWPLWKDLKRFAKLKGFTMRDLVVDGRLPLLD